jgi:hypothetical protein
MSREPTAKHPRPDHRHRDQPPRGGGDDDAWESLCELFESLNCDKEYWSKDNAERRKMARYGFKGNDGYFDELVRAL